MTLAPFDTHFYRAILDHLSERILVMAVEDITTFRVVFTNRTFSEGLGTLASNIGKTPHEIVPAQEADTIVQAAQQCLATGEPVVIELRVTFPSGPRWIEQHYSLLPASSEHGMYIITAVHDITDRKQQEETRAQQQSALIAELSTPLLTISDTAVVMPVIGAISTQRAQQITETLLVGIVERGASFVILDITGVPDIDVATAQTLMQIARAVQLLGAQIIVTGISPKLAQTLITLGIDLQHIITRSTLSAGINYVLEVKKLRQREVHYEPVFIGVPPPDHLQDMFSTVVYDVYRSMQDEESEFKVTGTVIYFDVTSRLQEIRIPTLVIVGSSDMLTIAMAQKTAQSTTLMPQQK